MNDFFTNLEKQNGLPSGFLNAVMTQESGGNPNAVSPKGALGAFQFMPATAQQYGIDPMNPDQAADGAARMYGDLFKKYNGDVPSALAAYNWGQGNLDRKGMQNAPPETQNYISKITQALPQQEQTVTSADQSQDFSHMSDEELQKIAGGTDKAPTDDLSHLSDEELMKIAGTQPEQAQPVKDPNILDRLSDDFGKRIDQTEKSAIRYKYGDQGATSTALQLIGNAGVGTAKDVVSEVAKPIASAADDFLSTVDPLVYGNAKQGLKKGINYAVSSPVGREVSALASYASGKWGNYAKEHPEGADNIRALLNIGDFATAASPVKGVSAIDIADKAASPIVDATGQALKKVGGAALSPVIPRTASDLAPLATRAQEFGIPLRLDQVSPTKARSNLQKVSQELPFSGSKAFEEKQTAAFNKAVAKTIGQDSENLGPETINKFLDDASDKFNSVLDGKDIPFDHTAEKLLRDSADTFAKDQSNEIGNIVKNQAEEIIGNAENGVISGKKLNSVRSDLLKRMKSMDSKARAGAADLIDKIDDIVDPHITGAEKETLNQARREWRNFRTIEPLLEKSTDGMINPTHLMQRVASSPFIKASRSELGSDELVDLARVGKQFLAKKAGSDTVPKAILGGGAGSLGLLTLTNPAAAVPALATAGAGLGANRALQMYNTSQKAVRASIKRAK